jgi:manganese-dependent inorganic pyrophosphatase
MHHIYLLGHRQPDTDSIASAIGYAEFLNRSEPGRYIPARCGDMNPETEYVLQQFGIPAPLLLRNVKPKLADISFKKVFALPESVPAVEIAALMAKEGIRNVAITDAEGKPVGIVGEYALAAAFSRRIHLSERTIAPIPVETLAGILDASVMVPACKNLEGKVYISVDALHVTLSKMTVKDIAVVGDNEPVQLALVSAGISCLILTNSAPASERLRAAAAKRGVAVISTGLDPFGVGKLISLLLPARDVMDTDVAVFTLEDSLRTAREVVSASRFRAACVVGTDGRLIGILTRTTLLDEVKKTVILLDHNEAVQAAPGIEEAEIIEIIDHHRLGAIATLKPVKFLNDPVGATSTLIAKKFIESGLTPEPATAGVLLSGILSDTLALRTSTTTRRDVKAAKYLAPLAGVDPDELGAAILEKGMILEGIPVEQLLTRDTKHYELSGTQVIVGQVMVPSFSFNRDRMQEIDRELIRLRDASGADLYACLFTSAFENASDLHAAGDADVLAALGVARLPIRLEGIMSRKKDFLPWLDEKLRLYGK